MADGSFGKVVVLSAPASLAAVVITATSEEGVDIYAVRRVIQGWVYKHALLPFRAVLEGSTVIITYRERDSDGKWTTVQVALTEQQTARLSSC